MCRTELFRNALAGAVMALVACGCSSSGSDHPEDVGVVQIALAAAPSDATCLQIDAVGARSLSKQFTLRTGGSATLQMTGLPLGDVQFTGSAFAEECGAAISSSPTWISDPVVATIVKGTIAQITLVLHRDGRASIRVDFSDGPADAGPGGVGGGSGGSGGLGGAVSTGGDRGSTGGIGGSKAMDGGTGGSVDGGSTNVCIPPSPSDIWERGTLPTSPYVWFATRPNDLWMVDDQAKTVRNGDGINWVLALTAPPNEYFNAVWGSSPDDVWVGGTRLRHWDGAAWSDLTPPGLLLEPSHTVRTLRGSTSDDVWLGATLPAAAVISKMFHWDGSSWTDLTPPDSVTGGSTTVMDVWVSPSHVAWVTANWVSGSQCWAGVLLWTGAAWEQSSLAVGCLGNNWPSIWGSSDNDVWAIGSNGTAHFDGTSWHLDYTSMSVSVTGAPSLWGSCASDIWAVGQGESAWHFDGVRWSEVVLDSRTSGRRLTTVTGTGPDDVWFGDSLVHTQGFSWHRYPNPAPACGNLRIDPGEDCDPPDGQTCDETCHRTCVAAGAACFGTSTGSPCCGGLSCFAGECRCVPTGSSCTDTDTCCSGGCTNGRCGCVLSGATCDAAHPCCPGSASVCSSGVCVPPPPTCMPDGARCSSNSPCCSGAPCVDGFCGADAGTERDGGGQGDAGAVCSGIGLPERFNCYSPVLPTTNSTCGQCLGALAGGDTVCNCLAGTERSDCEALLSCMGSGFFGCVSGGQPTPCYCSQGDCSTGADGPCAAQFNAVAGTSNTSAVMQQLLDPTSVVARVTAEAAKLRAAAACGIYCACL